MWLSQSRVRRATALPTHSTLANHDHTHSMGMIAAWVGWHSQDAAHAGAHAHVALVRGGSEAGRVGHHLAHKGAADEAGKQEGHDADAGHLDADGGGDDAPALLQPSPCGRAWQRQARLGGLGRSTSMPQL